ncbi:FG-GAP repeat domain-containing protein [Streptomyces sp. NPDC058052]|uniref:FG-GAP repeat domain-containing protein n=1 Tax=Streptomyces sp. NPDC058052 TaxID=3346316 RepID=UPI0036ED8EDF
MQFRSTGTRLASAATAVLAVTALGAGTLAMAPAAFAATSGPVPAAQQADEALPLLPEGMDLGGVGASGFLTYSLTHDGSYNMLWTPFDGGAATRVEVPEGGGWTTGPGDVLVLGDDGWSAEFRRLTLRDLSAPGTPDVTLDLAALNGTFVAALSRTSVLAQLKRADGGTELHIVTKDGSTTSTRKVTGLPDEAADFSGSKARDGSGAVAVAYERGPADLRSGGRAVIDPVTATATETYPASDSGYGWSGPDLSDSHLSWYRFDESLGGVVQTVDRKTGQGKAVQLGAHDGEWYHTLTGEWLIYGNPQTPPRAVSLTSGKTVALLDSATAATTTDDGSVIMRGARAADGKGLFRIVLAADGTPTITKAADEGRLVDLRIEQVEVPRTVELDRTGGRVDLAWTLSHREAYVDVVLTHAETGKQYHDRILPPGSGNRYALTWDAVIDGADAPDGTYAVDAEAVLFDGTGEPERVQSFMTLTRGFNAHDFIGNGSTDLLARDASGVLWLEDLRDRPVDGKVQAGQRIRVGGGWNTYKQIEAAGNIGGGFVGDVVALDGSGVLWAYDGRGVERGTFADRVRVGGGWGVYKQLAGGSDLDGDRRADLVAADTAGVLWFYKGTGDLAKPFAARVKIGGGWGVYNQLAAVGNIAGTAAGDLVARDTAGVLWLYQGDGRGKFLSRVRVGGGWGVFSQLVGAGDVNSDGRPDLVAYGAGGTYVYRSNGTVSNTFTRLTTSLFTGEGSRFTSVS